MLYLFALKQVCIIKGTSTRSSLKISRVFACDVGVDRLPCAHQLNEEELSVVVLIGNSQCLDILTKIIVKEEDNAQLLSISVSRSLQKLANYREVANYTTG